MSGWTDRWRVVLECKACSAQFEHERPNPAVELAPDGLHRFVMIGAPDECPRCAKKERGAKVVDIRCRRPAG